MHRITRTALRYSSLDKYKASTIKASFPSEYVLELSINRPEARHAMNMPFMDEMQTLLNTAHKDGAVRAIILSAGETPKKPIFSAGIDVMGLAVNLMECKEPDDVARQFLKMREFILHLQAKTTALRACRKPVIGAVDGGALGLAIDYLSACDIRYCTERSWFTIKEVDVGLAADVGTLQRIGKTCGNESKLRELAFTARNFSAKEAHEIGFVSSVAADRAELMDRVHEVARTIAQKSPVAVQGTKIAMNYARDHTVEESLEQIATWNGACLLSDDLLKSVMAMKEKKGPESVDYDDC